MNLFVGLLISATCFSVLVSSAAASAMCSWSGGGHFYSFDGAKVDYQGTCMFNMGSDCLANRLSLIGNSENRGGVASVSYVSYIVMRFGSTSGRITFIAGHYPSPADTSKVLVNGIALSLPFSGMGFSVTLVNETCDADIVLDVPAYDFQLRYSEWAVTLTVGDTYKSQMCGMCGNFNDNPDDDLIDGDFDARSDSNPGRAWGDYWTMDWDCLGASPTPDDVPSCTDNSYACSTVCDYLTNNNGIYGVAVQAMGATLAQYYKEDCQIDACMSGGQSLRKSVRQFLTVARLKYPACTGCNTSIAGFPRTYAKVYCNNDKCDCSSSSHSCQLYISMCGFWCDCIGRSSGYGTLYACWDDVIPHRCYPINTENADSCSAISRTSPSNPFPLTLS